MIKLIFRQAYSGKADRHLPRQQREHPSTDRLELRQVLPREGPQARHLPVNNSCCATPCKGIPPPLYHSFNLFLFYSQ